jgi:hypothetical protein
VRLGDGRYPEGHAIIPSAMAKSMRIIGHDSEMKAGCGNMDRF